MNEETKERIITILEWVLLPFIIFLAALWYFAIFSFIPTASGFGGGNGGARFSGFFGNQTVTIAVQTEPTSSHGTANITGIKVNGFGTGSISSSNWPSGISAGTQDLTITGDQNGKVARCRVSWSGS